MIIIVSSIIKGDKMDNLEKLDEARIELLSSLNKLDDTKGLDWSNYALVHNLMSKIKECIDWLDLIKKELDK